MKKREVAAVGKTEKRRGGSFAREISRIAFSVGLISVCAWITVPIGSIPFTLQTLAVALVGALLGSKRAVAAVSVYILLGLVGIPVFSGGKAGPVALFGPTGGYLFGFLFLAFLPGLFKRGPKRKQLKYLLLFVSMILGEAICYFFGTVWFLCLNHCTVEYAFSLCVLPFLLPDLIKFALAAFLAVKTERYLR